MSIPDFDMVDVVASFFEKYSGILKKRLQF